MSDRWQFWIDVGGTFTDCVARAPDGGLHTGKVLSSGATKGVIEQVPGPGAIVDSLRSGETEDFWAGYELTLLDADGNLTAASSVEASRRDGTLILGGVPVDPLLPGGRYELRSGEEAPIVAIRSILQARLHDPLPPLDVRLGTTRGTNALLERKGARTAFVTTRGFADVLKIANQDRPRLFDLAIVKPEPVYAVVVEIDERLDAQGNVLQAPDEHAIRRSLEDLRGQQVESVAICLLHAFANPAHEQIVERIARDMGFAEISTSSRLSPLIKIVSRGDTTTVDAYLNPILRQYVERLRHSLGEAPTSPLSRANSPDRKSDDIAGEGPGVRVKPEAFPTPDPPSSPSRTLKLMTSAGGLVDADRFVGKDSILSGPAGGVIGFSRVAEQAGFPRSIGFDMGGTSTDVSRYDGAGRGYELEFETRKAGVRVVAPMLAIETVAAGGGSICGFDGVKLFVGPESAGSDPGPACYGRGGPLTVTDVNLALGRILPERFPFPLDEESVRLRLQDLCDRVASSPLGTRYTPEGLAQGFVDIANANMVRAIRRVSVAKGYDPADYVLATFGGAGAQHACAMARLLGMRQILIHPFAGILSAYGMGLADVRRFAEQAVLQPFSTDTLQQLDAAFADMESRLRDEVRAEGIAETDIDPGIRSLDLRYRGLDSTIHIPHPVNGDYVAAYEAEHERLYGYRHSGRSVEIVAARMEVVGRLPTPDLPACEVTSRLPEPHATTQTWFNGEQHSTGVYLRADLQPGDDVTGPAIICEPTSTVIVDPGFRTRVLARGELLLSDATASATSSEHTPPLSRANSVNPETDEIAGDGPGVSAQSNAAATSLSQSSILDPQSSTAAPDPVQLEIFNNLFASIAEQMGVTLQRTSISTNVKERLDFSCAVFDPAGGLVCNAPHIPVHLGAMSETVRAVIADNPVMQPGDVYVTNDPYRGGSHLPDVTVVTPVFAENRLEPEDGTQQKSEDRRQRTEIGHQPPLTAHHSPPTASPLFFTASRAHHAEIGGIVPGSMPPFSSTLAEEGVLIRNFKLVDAGVSREEELRHLLTTAPWPTRNVQDNLSDVAAQVAANAAGARLLQDLILRYSLPVVQAYMGHIQHAASAKMRLALGQLPDGEYSLTDSLDNGAPIAVRITIHGETAVVDFTGTGPVLPSNLNANRAIVTAAVLYVFRCLIAEDIPLNSGVLEPVEIILPECLLNPPAHGDPARCAAIVGGNVETSQRVVDVLLGALQLAAASQGTMNNLTFGDATFGYYETICGGSGATRDADGADAVHTHMTNTRLTDVEVIERRYPVRVREFSIRTGSGGAGAHRGGDGIVRRIEFLRPLKVSMLSQRRGDYPPFGLSGGLPGTTGRNTLRKAGSDEEIDLGGCFQFDAGPGDILSIHTPGGGGWGTS